MGKHNKEYVFAFNGELLRHESLLEVKTGTTDEEWLSIIEETIKYFCFVQTLRNIAMPLLHEEWEKGDERIFRSIKRSVESLKKLDNMSCLKYDTKVICDKYAAMALIGVDNLSKMMKNMRAQSGLKISTDII